MSDKLYELLVPHSDTYRMVTGATSLDVADQFVECDDSGGAAYEITMPSVAEAKGRIYVIHRTDAAGYDITVAPKNDVEDDFAIVLDADKETTVLFSNGWRWIEIGTDTASDRVT